MFEATISPSREGGLIGPSTGVLAEKLPPRRARVLPLPLRRESPTGCAPPFSSKKCKAAFVGVDANFGAVRDALSFSLAAALRQLEKVSANSAAGTPANDQVRRQKEKQHPFSLAPRFSALGIKRGQVPLQYGD